LAAGGGHRSRDRRGGWRRRTSAPRRLRAGHTENMLKIAVFVEMVVTFQCLTNVEMACKRGRGDGLFYFLLHFYSLFLGVASVQV